ncbi:LolA family protein [Biostraticola tofi]|uniref:Outer membrane lipoprotein-sorting protein n=1 Tax=Biostraticola tofi TaxID=466109 RepID=A0A4R3YSP4_9GAMM|nr:outer membrane lipoprotein carrier protein LolA [Biostraticola tofi]TCV95432.1 outer membrane lipoprotein-sorting protein [Biostraticola tofi]
MKTWTLLLLLAVSAGSNAVTLDQLQQRFAAQPVIRAQFTQQRHISGVAPLRSSGELLIAREQGLWWRQRQPFGLTLILDDRRMVQVTEEQPPQIITAESNPQMFQFNHLLRALFQADRAVLEQNFSLEFTDKGQERWRLILTPRVAPLDKLFTRIQLEGQTYLDQIQLQDKQGDATDITFSRQSASPSSLNAQERQRFDVQ